MEWLDRNCDALSVTIIGGIVVALFTKYFLSNRSEKTSKRESSKKLTNEIACQAAPVKDDRLRISDLTPDEEKLYSELIAFTYRLHDWVIILAPLRYPQLDTEYSKFKIFLCRGIKDFDLKIKQSLNISEEFKPKSKRFLNNVIENCDKLNSFMGKDLGKQNENILEIAVNLKDEIQKFEKTIKQ